MPLRVNIPSQVHLISLEREGRIRKIYIKTRRKIGSWTQRKSKRRRENVTELRRTRKTIRKRELGGLGV